MDELFKALNSHRFYDIATFAGDNTKAQMKLFFAEGMPKPDGSSTERPSLNVSYKHSSDRAPFFTVPDERSTVEIGFRDQSGRYPSPLFRYEPDTPREGRHQNIRRTPVYTKERQRLEFIRKANRHGEAPEDFWEYPDVAYNAQYPYNHAHVTESGHIIEFDDTPTAERINIYHTSGTYIEIDANGTKMSHTKGDDFVVMERNGHVHVKGSKHVVIDGSSNVTIKGDANMEVTGNMRVNVGGEYEVKAKTIHLNKMESTLPDLFEDGSEDYLPLEVQNRTDEEMTLIEEPEQDSLAAAHRANMMMKGMLMPSDLLPKVYEELDRKAAGTGTDDLIVPEPTPIQENNELNNPMLKLSTHFYLKDLTTSSTIKDDTRPVQPQHGLSVEQIIDNLKLLCVNCLDKVKDEYQHFNITSGLRWANNPWSKSGSISRHELGLAADLSFPGKSKEEVIEIAQWMSNNLPFDKIFLEYSSRTNAFWIHIDTRNGGLRKQTFTAIQTGAKTDIIARGEFVHVIDPLRPTRRS